MGNTARDHFVVLDGLRGVAALGVVAMHVGDMLGLIHYPQHAYLAVPFFFMLSGFVIAHAYEDGLMRRAPAWRFLMVRVERLYPMLVAGLALGIAALVSGAAIGGHAAAPGQAAVWTVAALVMAPMAQGALPCFPLLPPQWSLAMELYGNVLHVAVRRWLTVRALSCALPLLFVAMATGAMAYGGFNTGWRRVHLPAAAATFGFCYGTGILLYRLRASAVIVRVRLPIAVIMLALIAGFAIPQAVRTPANAVRDIFCVLTYPLLIAAAMHHRPGVVVARWADRLGRLSYPLYISHYPIVAIGCLFVLHVHAGRLAQYAAMPALTAVAAVVAWSLLVGIDEPLRRRLRAVRQPRRGRPRKRRPRACSGRSRTGS